MSYADLNRLHTEHRYARQCLDLLHTAVSSLNRPPAGHAFVGLLQEAVAYFEHELPRHILEEEGKVYPNYLGPEGSTDLWRLREEHQDLWSLAVELARGVRVFIAEPTDEHWRSVRRHAGELEGLMRRHMVYEDEVLSQAIKSRLAMDSDARNGVAPA